MKLKHGLLLMLLYAWNATAQQLPTKTITGRVISASTHVPVEGAVLRLAHSKKTFISASDGSFTLTLNASTDSLFITHVSYEPKRVEVNAGPTPVVISLSESVTQMNEVQVSTGYQVIPKERATGSFYKVKSEQLNSRVSTDILSKLDGITSGLVFNKDPDGNTQIRIRGQSTIFANAEPLIVVDNFPYDGDISNINPNDVESVTLLKDAAAASIWGVRAGNGVIIITTKKGSFNQPLKIEFSSSITLGKKPDLYYDPNFLDASDFIDVEKTLFGSGFYSADEKSKSKPPLSPVVEILIKERDGLISATEGDAEINALRKLDIRSQLHKYVYRNPVLQQHFLRLGGGGNVMNYSLAAGYDKNIGAQSGSDYSRITLDMTNTYRPVRNLEFSGGINYTQNNTNRDNTMGAINTAGPKGKNIYPYAQLADASGNPLEIVKNYRTTLTDSAEAKGFLNWQFFPLKEKGLWTDVMKEYDTRVNLSAKYNVSKPLSLEIKYQYEKFLTADQSLAREQSFYARNLINHYSFVSPDGIVSVRNIPDGGILNVVNTDLASTSGRAQLNYSNDWQKHSVTAIAGMEVRQVTTGSNGNTIYGYDDDLATSQSVDAVTFLLPLYPSGSGLIPVDPHLSGTLNRFRSYFTTGSYTYDNRYTFSASGRIDQSNFFGVNARQRSVPLWSTGVKWDIDKEPFYHSAWFPSLKLRLTYGYNGNLDKTVTAFTTAYYLPGAYYTNANWAIIQTTPNPDLQWEKTRIVNLGIDFELKNKIITGTVEYYLKKGTDLMGDEVLAPSSGFAGPQGNYNFRGNFAGMTGRGLDVTLTSRNLDRAVKWYTSILFSYAADKVTKYDLSIPAYTYIAADGKGGSIYPFVGRPVYGLYSYRWAGLDPATGDPQGYLAGKISKDYGAISSTNDPADLVYSGPARPVFSGGLYNTFSYKGFSVAANISYKLGYYFRRSSINYSSLFNAWNGNKDFTRRWQKPGDEKTTDVPSMPGSVNTARDNFYLNSSALVEKGDQIRLQDISLSYTFLKSKWLKKPFDHLELYIYTNNVGILWRANKEGLDPEYPTGGIPPSETISFGIKAGL